MAEKKFSKGSEEWQMFQDYWKLCQKLWILEESDEYWEQVIKLSQEFHEKYNTVFSKHAAIALINSLDEKYKKEHGTVRKGKQDENQSD